MRNVEPREWSEFPEQAEAQHLAMTFDGESNADDDWVLELRQVDVKQAWDVRLNDIRVGQLDMDEIDRMLLVTVPAGTVRPGKNTLRIASRSKSPDDVRVGQIALYKVSREQRLKEGALELQVRDGLSKQLIPARITIVRQDGALQPVADGFNQGLAVRPGTVYTVDGRASLGIPAGTYTVYAGAGFEFSLAKAVVTVERDKPARQTLTIGREVLTPGYVACDTHLHTLTHSGHGDASDRERMITLAAEGIELPIATDHNTHVDHDPVARTTGVRKRLTPVIGNEVTTPVGHFNVFPVERKDVPVPDFKSSDWNRLHAGIGGVPGVKVVILNHARDMHSGVRPFGPNLFNAASGEHLDGRVLGINAMEVVNSSATQTDPLQLFRDWMALLNRGRAITPVGSSDSHDVARHFVGQGRTYIRCDDRDPGAIDVDQAVASFLAGRVMVSYGLLAELTVNGTAASGDIAAVSGNEVHAAVRVLGPHWVSAQKVMLFANGQLVRETEIPKQDEAERTSGIKWAGEWTLPRPQHDVHLVAIAMGPGIAGPYWRTAKPYQPVSPDWTPHVLGCSGAVWLDVDGDGRPTSARAVAEAIIVEPDAAKLIARLGNCDRAVAIQAAALLDAADRRITGDEMQAALKEGAQPVREGFADYIEAQREGLRARQGLPASPP